MGIKDNKNGTYTLDYRNNGKRYRQTIRGSKKLAEKILAKRLTDITEERFFPTKKDDKVLFRELAKKYWKIHGGKTKSAPKLIYTIRQLCNYFGDIRARDISPERVQEFYNQKMADTTPSTANRHFTLLRAIFNKALKLKFYHGENPCIGVAREKENPPRTRYLTANEIVAFINAAPMRSKALFACAIYTGMRQGELLNMDWKDIDLDANMIYILKSKSGKKREVPILSSLKEILVGLGPKGRGKVFSLTIPQIRHDFQQTLLLSNITGVRFHDLRHTFASHFIMNGESISTLQCILGHSSETLTHRYAHLSPTFLRKSIEVIKGLVPIFPLQEQKQI